MVNRISLLTITVFFAAIFVVSAAQAQQTQAQQAQTQQARPLSQPRTPATQQPAQQAAQSQPIANRPGPIQPPFVLSAEQQKYIDQLLERFARTSQCPVFVWPELQIRDPEAGASSHSLFLPQCHVVCFLGFAGRIPLGTIR